MQFRESEIHFSRWIFERKEKNWLNICILSAMLHVLLFLFLYYTKPAQEIVANRSPSSIKVNFSNQPENLSTHETLKKNHFKKLTKEPQILTNHNNKSQSNFSAPAHSSINEIRKKKDEISKFEEKIPENNLNSFLPNANNNYLNNLRKQSLEPKNNIIGDDGDIPIEGPSLAPTNEPRVLSRYAEKDMDIFQFTQEFRERFSAVWNSEDRVVPPASPLRPGDIIYYKIYVNSNGSLQKFENLSYQEHPQKDYSDIDKLFSQVIVHVFPMQVPPKFAQKNVVLSEVVAIQVVDRNMPIRFSF